MKRRFNTTGICIPEKHYMVDLNSRLRQIRALVDEGAYFTINRARQYGKTTTLHALGAFLAKDYLVVSLDFQALGAGSFHDESTFSQTFAAYFLREFGQLEYGQEEAVDQSLERLRTVARHKGEKFLLFDLFDCLIQLCAVTPKPIVLMIDEADSAANNQVFLDFLAQLRNYYLARDMGRVSTFQSVILAGVYDVRNLKRKIRTEDDHKSNSPWNTHAGNEENGSLLTFDDCPWDYREPVPYNIAADFEVVMSFSVKDIEGMLAVYEKDHQTGMDVRQMAELIFADTAGYPFLVSRLCKLMDEKVAAKKSCAEAWTKEGFLEAERMLLAEKNPLFDSLMNKLEDYPELDAMIQELLFSGRNIIYSPDNPAMDMALMFGFARKQEGSIFIANRIFETRLYNLYLSTAQIQGTAMYRASLQDKREAVGEIS